jgi:hypothetical protein
MRQGHLSTTSRRGARERHPPRSQPAEFAYGDQALRIGELPIDCLGEAGIVRFNCLPAERGFGMRGVDGIAPVVPRPVADQRDHAGNRSGRQWAGAERQAARRSCGLARGSALHSGRQTDRFCLAGRAEASPPSRLDIQPVPHVGTGSVNRDRCASKRVPYHGWNQFSPCWRGP